MLKLNVYYQIRLDEIVYNATMLYYILLLRASTHDVKLLRSEVDLQKALFLLVSNLVLPIYLVVGN